MRRLILPLLLLVFVFAPFVDADEPNEHSLERLKYNNPGLVVDLGVGLWAWPVPVDVRGDGFPDLIVTCEDKPYNGTYYFENTRNDRKRPVFKPARRISAGVINVQPSYVAGTLRVLTPATEYPDFVQTGISQPVPIPDMPENVHPKKLRGNMWRYVDYNGNGKIDLVIGTDCWTDYGWDNAYNEKGEWQNGPLRGNIYIAVNLGTNDTPKYDKPIMINDSEGNPLESFGWPSPNFADWDDDGDLDIIVGEFRDGLYYFENAGTRTEPQYMKIRPLLYEDGSAVCVDLQMITPVAYDWDGDGHLDIIAGDEDGRIAFFENTGKIKDGMPLFEKPHYFQQIADEVKCGALATPCGVDWDSDGDWDIVSGNTAGYIVFYENLSGPGVELPKWAEPQYLETQGERIRIMAGPNGSIQGPCESKWGYTTLTVADWDGDGLADIIVNSIWGKVLWYRNIGSKGNPKLAVPLPVEVEWEAGQPILAWGWLRPKGKELLTQWRTTPVAVDWNKDGLTDLVMLDTQGYPSFFERYQEGNSLKLKAPQRIFADEQGPLLHFNPGAAGKSGRRKLCIVDYDGDGRLDILLNGSNADLYRQIKAEDGLCYFEQEGPIDQRPIQGHSTSPTVVDFNNDGVADPVIGAEDGYFYYKRNDNSFLLVQ